MPTRIYICNFGDGMGNIGHMIDRAGANMALNAEFRKNNPEIYIFEGGTKEQKKSMVNKLSNLDSSHPLHISNLHTTENAKGNLYIIDDISRDNTPYGSIDDSIVYHVSIPNFRSSKWVIHNLQFWYSLGGISDDPFDRNMGFGPSGYGMFVKYEPTAQTLNENEIPVLTRSLLNYPDIAKQILGSDVYEEGVQAIKQFKSGKRALIHLYSHEGDNVNEYIDSIKNSPAMHGKYLVFLVTGKGSFIQKDTQANYVVIKTGYMEQELYSLINQLKTSDISFASGDKSFEEAINAGAMPIVFGNSASFYSSFIEAIKNMQVVEARSEQHNKIIEILSTLNIGDKLKLLTPELLQYWQTVYIPYIKDNWNYYTNILKWEEQVVALYELDQDPTKVDLWKKFNHIEKINLLSKKVYKLNFDTLISLVRSIDSDAATVLALEEQEHPGNIYKKVNFLTCEGAKSMYKSGWTMSDLLNKHIFEIYKTTPPMFDQLAKIDDMEKIKELISYARMSSDQPSVLSTAKTLVKKLISYASTWSYGHESIKLTDLLDLNVEQIRQVINSSSPVKKLEEIKAQISADISKLVIAAAQGDLNLVKMVEGILSKEAMAKSNEKGWSALTAATYYGQEEIVKELVEHLQNKDQADANGNKPSIIAESPYTGDFLGVIGSIDNKGKNV